MNLSSKRDVEKRQRGNGKTGIQLGVGSEVMNHIKAQIKFESDI